MPKNIVICFDGTNNRFGTVNTNVVKLCATLVRRAPDQIVFYDPGVGTIGDQRLVTRIGKAVSKLIGSAIGAGLRENLSEAYAFLSHHYEPDDKIYIFGFSRGAYTARALAGLIHMLGLAIPRSEHLWPYLWGMYKCGTEDPNERFRVAEAFLQTFTRRVPIRFVGVWDTVSSVGWFWDPVALPYTAKNSSVQTVRHAVAIDEKRAFFRQNLWNEDPKTQAPKDVKQCWFPGVHCDIGGGYPEGESGLSKIALEWMLDEAEHNGLLVNSQQKAAILGSPVAAPAAGAAPVALERLLPKDKTGARTFARPDPNAMMHESLTFPWWPLEFLLRFRYKPGGGRRLAMNLFGRRRMSRDACVHPSVAARANYAPPNKPAGARACP